MPDARLERTRAEYDCRMCGDSLLVGRHTREVDRHGNVRESCPKRLHVIIVREHPEFARSSKAERVIVDHEVAGSSPVGQPSFDEALRRRAARLTLGLPLRIVDQYWIAESGQQRAGDEPV